MVDMNRFIELKESLRADEPHRGQSFYRLELTYRGDDNNKPIFHEMLTMLGDGISIGNIVGMKRKIAVVKADDKIIIAYESANARQGFMLHIDTHGNLIGEEVDVFEVLSVLRSEV